jgi:endonuclease-8
MPEGDTIRRLAERINRRFAGRRCDRCVTRDPRLVGVDFAGRVLREADARGKHLLIRFDDERTLFAHLRLDGSFVVGPTASVPAWRRRIELWIGDGRLTGVDVPVLGVVATAHEDTVVGHLGPDLCGPALPDLDAVVARMLLQPDEPLGAALLDQRNAAGFGNVYAVELPFIVGIAPQQPVGSIEGLGDLVAVGAAVIRTNAERGPQNTTGRRLHAADHWIYTKGGRPCPLCATVLDGCTDRESPWGRVTVWCPGCQPLEPRRAVDLARARRLLALHPARRQSMFPPPIP